MSSTTTVVVVTSTVVVVGSIEVVLTSSEVASTAVVVDGSGASDTVGDVDELEQPTLLSAPASTTPNPMTER